MIRKHKDKFCEDCGKPLPKRNMKTRNGITIIAHTTYCQYCNPFDPIKEKNKFEQRSETMANQYPYLVKILYECPCISEKKVKHHFDYSRPYEVILLCNKCHGLEHKRLNKLKKQNSHSPRSKGSGGSCKTSSHCSREA